MIVAGSGTTAGKVYKIVPTIVDENIVWTESGGVIMANEQIIIEQLKESLRLGKITLQDIPEQWRVKLTESEE